MDNFDNLDNSVNNLTGLELFIEEANSLLAVLAEYNSVTDKLSEVNMESSTEENDQDDETMAFVIDDIQNIIEEREEIGERADIARTAMVEAIAGLDTKDKQSVRNVFEGGQIENGADFPALGVICKLLSVQKDIMGKDKAFNVKFKAKQEEVRLSLKDLQGDKKKLDFLNVNASPQESVSFDV